MSSDAAATRLRVTRWRPDVHEVHDDVGGDEFDRLLDWDGVVWLEVHGFGDKDILRRIAERLEIPSLALEDVVHVPQRPKLEELGPKRFVILRTPRPEGDLALVQVSIWAHGNVVATFRDEHDDPFEFLRARTARSDSISRSSGADYFTYRLIDSSVDAYFPHLDSLADRMDDIEQAVLHRVDADSMHELHKLRRKLRTITRATAPLADVTASLPRQSDPYFSGRTEVFLADVHDHALQIAATAEHLRDVAADVRELIQGTLDERMNRTMRALTAVTTIFIPLSFVAGLYGMNFDSESPYNMPELGWRFGYPFVLVTMALVALGMFLWFRRRGWTEFDQGE